MPWFGWSCCLWKSCLSVQSPLQQLHYIDPILYLWNETDIFMPPPMKWWQALSIGSARLSVDQAVHLSVWNTKPPALLVGIWWNSTTMLGLLNAFLRMKSRIHCYNCSVQQLWPLFQGSRGLSSHSVTSSSSQVSFFQIN